LEPKTNFIKILGIINKLIKIIVSNQGYIAGTPKFNDHVIQNWEKHFPE